MHRISIDRGKPLAAEPQCGHNRWHPDLAPAFEVGEGEEIALETRARSTGRSPRRRRSPIFPRSMPARCIR
jgi:formamidase